jgi:hypothetical protein
LSVVGSDYNSNELILEEEISKNYPHHEEDAEVNTTFIWTMQKWGLQSIS